MPEEKIPVVIDCDPGVDDAHALLMALASERLDVQAITTVSGNMPLDITTGNALRVTELAGVPVPVSSGSSEALCRSEIPHSELFHGKNGLGGATLPDPTGSATGLCAVEALRRAAEEAGGRLHIIALGPLTNLALLFKVYPHIKAQIAHLTVMGGSRQSGNITPQAEFNFYCDAEAAEIVMSSGVPITFLDLEGCESAMLFREDADEITALPSRISPFLQELWNFNLALAARFGESGFVIHDAIAVASVIEPTLITTRRCRVQVLTGQGDCYGKSVVSEDENGAVLIADKTDKTCFLGLCRKTMEHYPL